jgi:hypothetical protein
MRGDVRDTKSLNGLPMDGGSWQTSGALADRTTTANHPRTIHLSTFPSKMASILPELIEIGNRIEEERNKASGCFLNAFISKGFLCSVMVGGLGGRTQITSRASDTHHWRGPWRHNDHIQAQDPFFRLSPSLNRGRNKDGTFNGEFQSANPLSGPVGAMLPLALTPPPAVRPAAGCSPWLGRGLSGNGCVLLLAFALRWCQRFGGFLWLTFDQLLH